MASQKKEKNSPYVEKEKDRHVNLLENNPKLFYRDEGWGLYNKYAKYSYFLQYGENNFYKVIRDKCRDKYINEKPKLDHISEFFKNGYNIDLHSPKDTVSSQVACLNHLFPIRQNKDAILAILNGIGEEVFEDLEALSEENGTKVYVAFEICDRKILSEPTPTRVDALILAKKNKNSKNVTLVVIEWKYTECEMKYVQNKKDFYGKILDNGQSKSLKNHKGTNLTYYHYPFYQLMRETLWAESLIRWFGCDGDRNGENEINGIQITNKDIKFEEDYIHLHVVPNGNEELRKGRGGKDFSYNDLEETWKRMLKFPERYILIDPGELFKPLDNNRSLLTASGSPIKDADDFIEYLRIRYW